jgi:heat-inducible transcriptional repressor
LSIESIYHSDSLSLPNSMGNIIPSYHIGRPLSAREEVILRSIVSLYILKASPVGSRPLAKYLEDNVKLSPATIRNVMSDLEELEFISHPHTSAGRIPTDKGYRFYVDNLSKIEQLTTSNYLSIKEIEEIKNQINNAKNESDAIFRETSKFLGTLSRYLSIVRIPQVVDLVLQKIELIPLSSTRVLVVLALESNVVRTVSLEAEFEFEHTYIEKIANSINEKLAGKTLKFLKENFKDILFDWDDRHKPLIRLFVNSIDKIFSAHNNGDKIVTAGTQNLLKYPEFEDLSRVKSIIELVENENIIIHLLNNIEDKEPGTKVLIGKEMEDGLLDDYSVVVSTFQIGSASGSIGLIGPKRMNYPKMMAIVGEVAQALSGID